MGNQPLVCICIPVYNNVNTIEKTVESLIKQTYQNIIIKIINNASDDGTTALINGLSKKYKSIHIIHNEQNIGGEANFTKCIQQGEGQYTAIYHADDIYSESIVSEQVAVLENSNVVAAFTHANTINSVGDIIGERLLPKELGHLPFLELNFEELFKLTLKYGNLLTTPTAMVKTDVYQNSIISWQGEKYKTSADLDVWFRLAQCGAIAFIPNKLINYRVAEESYSYNLARARVTRHDFFLVIDFYLSKPKVARQLTKIDKNFYAYLIFKDNVNININLLIKNKLNEVINIKLIKYEWLKIALSSKYHFKIFLAGITFKIFLMISSFSWARQLLFNIRFGSFNKKSN